MLRLLYRGTQVCLELPASAHFFAELKACMTEAPRQPGLLAFGPFLFLTVPSMFSILSILQFRLRKLYKQLSSAPGSKRYASITGILHSISFRTKYLFLFVWKKE